MPEKKKMRPITKFFIGAGVGTVIGLIFLLVVLGINGQLNFSSSNSQQATNMQPENTLSKEENDSIVLREIKGEELLAAVQDSETKKYGFIDTAGKYVISPIYEYACNFSEGLAFVQKDNKVGFINTKGEFAIELGNAISLKTDYSSDGIFTQEGVIPDYYSNEIFQEGLAAIAYVKTGDKYPMFKYIDKEGRTILDGYTFADEFVDGIALVATSRNNGWPADFTYIDSTGKNIINKSFSSASSFSEGYACVGNEDNLFGYIDRTGNLVIPYQYKDASDFSEGYALVTKGDPIQDPRKGYEHLYMDSAYYIDTNGNRVIDENFPQYVGTLNFSVFHDGVASALIDGKPGYIDKKGKVVLMLPEIYSNTGICFFPMIHGFAFVSDDNDMGYLIDNQGNQIVNNLIYNNEYPYFSYVDKSDDNMSSSKDGI